MVKYLTTFMEGMKLAAKLFINMKPRLCFAQNYRDALRGILFKTVYYAIKREVQF